MPSNVGFKGIDVRQAAGLLLFRAFLQSSAGALVTSGTTTLRIYELQSDGTIKTFDFSTNTFVATAPTSPSATMTYQKAANGTVDTGLWTYPLSTTAGFTIEGVYLAHATNSGASPPDQLREFQYASAEGDLFLIASGTAGKSFIRADVEMIAGSSAAAATLAADEALSPPTLPAVDSQGRVTLSPAAVTAIVQAVASALGLSLNVGTVVSSTASSVTVSGIATPAPGIKNLLWQPKGDGTASAAGISSWQVTHSTNGLTGNARADTFTLPSGASWPAGGTPAANDVCYAF